DVDVGSAPLAAHGDALNQLRSHNHELLWAAQGLFITTAHLLARSGSIMLLTDPHGVVLEVAGDMRIAEAAQDIHLMAGGNWHEGVVGTNGIGTALATRLPVQVHAAEHFRESVRQWTCAAAPIFLPGTDQILGVVDISGPPSSHQVNSLVLAVAAARQIEAVLAERLSREHTHLLDACLRFSGRRDSLAVMVLNSSAQLIHISGSLPGTDLRLGSSLPGLEPGRQVEEWARRLPEGLRPEWLHPVSVDSRSIGALLVVPKRVVNSAVSAQTHSNVIPCNRVSSVFGGVGRGLGPSSEADASRSSFDCLLGQSTSLRSAVERAQMLSGRRVAVLIQGETGVGKELFARAVHGDESRSGPFV
ncbi:sigma-54-dependent Fis family transcriptional regulator, partial [Roseateles sp. GG27B]